MRRFFYLIFACLCLIAAVSCGDKISAAYSSDTHASGGENIDRAMELLTATTPEFWNRHLDSMPDDDCVKLRVAPPPGALRKCFCDSNYLHYAAGEQFGIKPILSPDDIWSINRPLVKISSCAEYFVDSLSHSYPYLVPDAAKLLAEIGQAFNDSLRSRGGGCYRIKVTSLLRTDQSIRRLRRVNRIAVDSSSHRYATSFDISYLKFICDASTVNRTQEDLKNLLAEIIHDFHTRGRCLVIFERKQACFHITAIRPEYVRPPHPVADGPRRRKNNS